MDVQTVIFFYGLLAIVGIFVLAWFGLMFVAARFSDSIAESYDKVRRRLSSLALTGAWAVATLAMAGSLYFSEIAHFPPCTLCWYQRIAMYPLVLILGIAVIKRDVGVRLYAIPVAVVGAIISSYHYLLEWFPELDSGACVVGTPCTTVWFREFGFVSIPFLALIAFLLVIVLLLVPSRRQAAEPEVEDSLEEDDV
jgi:disulfide bond formation protein DsbB